MISLSRFPMLYPTLSPILGPPAPPAGLYIVPGSVTSHSARIVWTVSNTLSHGSTVNRYDIESEIQIKEGEWVAIMTGW